jgi:hypothetical protein
MADVYEALVYYFDHRAEIDESTRDGEAFAQALREQTPSKVSRKLAAREPRGERIKLYTDEDIPRVVVRGLRERGVDTLTVSEADRLWKRLRTLTTPVLNPRLDRA